MSCPALLAKSFNDRLCSPKARDGFTLVELIMIITIGSVLTIGIVKYTAQQVANGTQMRDYLIALNLAQLEMAQMNNTAYSTLPVSNTATLAQEASFPGFDIQRIVSAETTGSPNGVKYKRIDFKIDYHGGSFTNPLVWLVTYREDHITFGDGI